MATFLKLEPTRHQVAIAGRVTDAQTGKPIAQAEVQIAGRPGCIRTAADGHFHYLDLPAGNYTLDACLPGAGSRYGTGQVQVTVSHDGDNITLASADITLAPTTLKGQVTDQGSGDPVVMAEVRIKGSGERAFSDGQGHYLLTGLEAGQRTVQASAQGYEPAVQAVLLAEAGTEQLLNLALNEVT